MQMVFQRQDTPLEQMQEEETKLASSEPQIWSSWKHSCSVVCLHHFWFLFSAAVPTTGWLTALTTSQKGRCSSVCSTGSL